MTILKNIRLGLLHVSVAMTFVLINGVLNRVMIENLGILATVVAILTVLPQVLSPLQVFIGQYSDTHPIFGLRRTPYIALGLLLCVGGTVITPYAAFLMGSGNWWVGGLLGALAFGTWGFGYNLAVVAYMSLASDMSTEVQRSRTIAVMWFMMIVGLIVTGVITGRLLREYSEAKLIQVFWSACGISLVLGALSLIGLEPRRTAESLPERHRPAEALRAVATNPQARLFFCYLTLMLAAILGQDVLLEPFGARVFGMSVEATTQLTPVWGGATLVSLLLYGIVLSRWMSKKTGAVLGGVIAVVGLVVIAMSGMLGVQGLFVPGVAALGFGTGIATSTNLALMLDMTTSEQIGLYIGAWSIADAAARGLGTLLGGTMRDAVTALTGSASTGYVSVFLAEAVMLSVSLLLLRYVDVAAFRNYRPGLTQLAAAMADA